MADPNTSGAERDDLCIKRNLHNLFIGFAAGAIAAFFPRIFAALASAGSDAGLEFLTGNYVILAVAFAAIIAVAVLYLEYDSGRVPRDIFIAALGVPALLSASFQGSSGANSMEMLVKENARLLDQVVTESGIQVVPKVPTTLRPIAGGDLGDQSSLAPSGLLQLFGIRSAYAACGQDGGVWRPEASDGSFSNGFVGVPALQRRAFVIIEQVATESEAIQRTHALRARFPNAQAMESDGGFVVAALGRPLELSEALEVAKGIKTETGLVPTVVTVPPKVAQTYEAVFAKDHGGGLCDDLD